jgi:hypothetical protein
MTCVAEAILGGFLFAFFLCLSFFFSQWLSLPRAFSHTQFNHRIDVFRVENKTLYDVHTSHLATVDSSWNHEKDG